MEAAAYFASETKLSLTVYPRKKVKKNTKELTIEATLAL
jgi:hypothetical protein